MKTFIPPFLILLISILIYTGCGDGKWEGQGPIQVVPTKTLPIQQQWKGTFDLGEGIFASNDFEGARMNGAVFSDDTVRILINPENTPINSSPWYAFKIWADVPQSVTLKLTYLDGYAHRYPPKTSLDGDNWETLDSSRMHAGPLKGEGDGRKLPDFIVMDLDLGPDTLWVAAQELLTSSDNISWIKALSQTGYTTYDTIGYSREDRAIHLLKIGESNDQRMIFVLSRQHPPEVTGYLAMRAFVEMVASDHPTAQAFREQFNTYVVPMANPDGVDNGHWRHNAGGIDLNRDWQNLNQPEIRSIQQFLTNKVQQTGGRFYFGVDFHSTWEDIYYTIDTTQHGNFPGLIPTMIEQMALDLELDPNIRSSAADSSYVTSSKYFFYEFGAEALTYEIGDNTPRELLKRKGEVSALKLMELLLKGDSE